MRTEEIKCNLKDKVYRVENGGIYVFHVMAIGIMQNSIFGAGDVLVYTLHWQRKYHEGKAGFCCNSDFGKTVFLTREAAEKTLEIDENEQKCRVCGCTWNNACEGGCYWVEDDLCSKCAEIGGGEK